MIIGRQDPEPTGYRRPLHLETRRDVETHDGARARHAQDVAIEQHGPGSTTERGLPQRLARPEAPDLNDAILGAEGDALARDVDRQGVDRTDADRQIETHLSCPVRDSEVRDPVRSGRLRVHELVASAQDVAYRSRE